MIRINNTLEVSLCLHTGVQQRMLEMMSDVVKMLWITENEQHTYPPKKTVEVPCNPPTIVH